jgi:hypothetical protein
MVGELMGKVSAEVKQRHEVEGLVRRLQTENSKMKVCSSSFMFQFYRWSYDGVI